MLKPGYSFAVLADIDKQVKGRIAYMGRDKSVFRVTFEPAENLFEIKSEKYEDYYSALAEMIRQYLKKRLRQEKFRLRYRICTYRIELRKFMITALLPASEPEISEALRQITARTDLKTGSGGEPDFRQ